MSQDKRLLHRTEPFHDESLNGFLMRVVVNNQLLDVDELLVKLTRQGSRNIRYQDIPEVAYFMKNSVPELSQLSGFERSSGGEMKWLIDGQWLTKSVFINLRDSKVCPHCLDQADYLRGIWQLSFYSTCAWHDIQLIDTCPNCHRSLKWNRRRPGFCGCGQQLSKVESHKNHSSSTSLSKILAYQLSGDFGLISRIPIPMNAVERLANLSLDGICKTIWFLGHCIPDIGHFGTGHGRKKPNLNALDLMSQRAFKFLSEWPNALGEWMGQTIIDKLQPGFSLQECHRLMAPADNYFRSSLDDPELGFLTKSYQQYLELIWCAYGKRHPASDFDKQILLPF